MGCRISTKALGARTRISVAGELPVQGVGELKRVSAASGDSLTLDLSDLRFADDDGVEALVCLIDKGATVLDASPFVPTARALTEEEAWIGGEKVT